MDYFSTKGLQTLEPYSLDFALMQGLAPDGGLYIPESFALFEAKQLEQPFDLATLAQQLLQPFFAGSVLETDLTDICQAALNFPVKVKPLSDQLALLELFHGPTLSFKDFGARFLAECLNRLLQKNNQKRLILVATSGDTGSAVAAAFHGQSQVQVAVLFPENKISVRQQAQICCWGDNIQAIAVKGNFDDCQRLVKSAYTSDAMKTLGIPLSTSNSINIGRLLPQMSYYAYASLLHQQQSGEKLNLVVPSGNLGNVTAAFWAKQCGLPIDQIAIGLNANQVLLDYQKSAQFEPRASIETLANAMDVGSPSNFERLQALYDHEAFKQIPLISVSDAKIKQTIQAVYQQYNELICPHTAVGVCCAETLLKQRPNQSWLVAATAHPAKFESVLEPLLNLAVPVPERLQALIERQQHYQTIEANLEALVGVLSTAQASLV